MAESEFDVIVIGGGAAGLLAAAAAAENGARVGLLEKNRKLGVKILMSGGTRCNVTHHCDARGIVEAYGKPGRFLHSALAALSPSDVVKLVESQGVPVKVEETGKIFPVSDRAIDVRDALVRLASLAGAKLITESPVVALDRTSSGWSVGVERPTGSQSLTAQAVIVTTGGKSYPGCGTVGDGYHWAERLGHTLIPPIPALVPILSNTAWANSLKGVTLERVRVAVVQSAAGDRDPNGDHGKAVTRRKHQDVVLATAEGGFLFTHWGFSGPTVLDVSREVARHPDRKSLKLVCDFLPDQRDEGVVQHLDDLKQKLARQQVGSLLQHWFPRRLAEALVEAAGISLEIRNADLKRTQILALVETLKRQSFSIQGTLGFEKAEVTAGGIDLAEVDSKTLQSKKVPGLFFAGEILDLDGPIGGFNFQAAFSTGWLAGQHAAWSIVR